MLTVLGLVTPRYLGHKNIQHRVRYSSSPPNTLPFRLTKCTPAQAWQVTPLVIVLGRILIIVQPSAGPSSE